MGQTPVTAAMRPAPAACSAPTDPEGRPALASPLQAGRAKHSDGPRAACQRLKAEFGLQSRPEAVGSRRGTRPPARQWTPRSRQLAAAEATAHEGGRAGESHVRDQGNRRG